MPSVHWCDEFYHWRAAQLLWSTAYFQCLFRLFSYCCWIVTRRRAHCQQMVRVRWFDTCHWWPLYIIWQYVVVPDHMRQPSVTYRNIYEIDTSVVCFAASAQPHAKLSALSCRVCTAYESNLWSCVRSVDKSYMHQHTITVGTAHRNNTIRLTAKATSMYWNEK